MTGIARYAASAVLGFASLGACLSGSELPGQRGSSEAAPELVVSPALVKLSEGQRVTLRAMRSRGSRARISIDATWASAAPEVAAVSREGVLTARSPGVTEITAAAGGLSATARVEVVAPPEGEAAAVLLGAGDIGDCGSGETEATARILDTIPGTVFTAGDNAYPRGSASNFAECYDLTWGRHRHRTRPSPGNHDYRSGGAAPYFDYFGVNAGDPEKGYYSYDLGAWHVIALNSETDTKPGSLEEQWLRADLAASRARCTLAYMHRPRFSSGDSHGSQRRMAPLFEALYQAGVEIVIGGHDHVYERFAPQTPSGQLDRQRGVRQFVVGTGGRKRDGFKAALPNSEARYNETKGVIKLTLFAGRYEWEFIPVSGSFRDRGGDTCH